MAHHDTYVTRSGFIEYFLFWLTFVYQWIYDAPEACFVLDVTYTWKELKAAVGYDTFDLLRFGTRLESLDRGSDSRECARTLCNPRHENENVIISFSRAMCSWWP